MILTDSLLFYSSPQALCDFFFFFFALGTRQRESIPTDRSSLCARSMIHEQPGGRVLSRAERCLGPGVEVTDVTPLSQGELKKALLMTVSIFLTFLSPSLSPFSFVFCISVLNLFQGG